MHIELYVGLKKHESIFRNVCVWVFIYAHVIVCDCMYVSQYVIQFTAIRRTLTIRSLMRIVTKFTALKKYVSLSLPVLVCKKRVGGYEGSSFVNDV